MRLYTISPPLILGLLSIYNRVLANFPILAASYVLIQLSRCNAYFLLVALILYYHFSFVNTFFKISEKIFSIKNLQSCSHDIILYLFGLN